SAAPERNLSMLGWVLPFLRPYRGSVVAIVLLAILEIGLGALAPWPLQVVVDNVLGGIPLPGPLAVVGSFAGSSLTLLLIVVVAGLLLQIASEAVSMVHTQIQVKTGQHLVYDLRARLLAHLQNLPLKHHVLSTTADSVYRLDADAYCVDDLVLGGIFPLATA